MEKSVFKFQGETRYLSWSGEEFFIKNSMLMCILGTDQYNKLKLRIDIHQTAKDLYTSVTIVQGPGPLKFLTDDIEQQCKDGGFKIKLITRDTLKFRSKDPADPNLIKFGQLLVKMKKLKSVVDDPFGMMVHDMSMGDICSTYSGTQTFKKKPDNWTHKSKSKKETELSDKKNFPLSNKNGIFNRSKTRQTVQFPARKSTSSIHMSKQDTFHANPVHQESTVVDNESFQTSPEHIRDTYYASRPNLQIEQRPVSSIPLSSKESTSNVMATPTSERTSQFYGSRSTTYCTPQPKLNLIASHKPSSTLQKRASSFNTGTNLNKKSCISPNRSENKENQSHCTSDHHLNKEGFSNLGNTCYMNAGLQALFHSKSFADDLITTFNEMREDLDQNCSFRAISSLLIERNSSSSVYSEDHYKTLLTKVKDSIDSSCKNFRGNCMQDVQEFHNKILYTMQEEISMVIENSGKCNLINPVESNFKMTMTETLTCSECGNVVSRSQVAYDLALQVPRPPETMQMALKTNFAEELREFNCLKCSHNQSKAKTTISCLPKILTIFLKRYKFFDGQVSKDDTSVDVPDFLTLQEFVEENGHKTLEPDYRSIGSTEPSTSSVQSRDFQMGEGDHQENSVGNPSSFGDNKNVNMARYVTQSYQLTSAVCHQGSANAGHYVCYGIDNPRQRYKLFDDSNVSEISKKAASSALKENGYLFIYEKVTTL